MEDNKQINVMQSVYKRNEEIAEELNRDLTSKGIFCINILGAPGVGKTSSLIGIIKSLDDNCAVIEGDVEGDIDTLHLKKLGINTVQINTGGSCHLNAIDIKKILPDLNLKNGFLFIENIGNLICPADFLIGEHIKILITSVTEGSDKPYKYPLAFEKADILIINKMDLVQYTDFDESFFMDGVKKLNPNISVFKVSSKNIDGFVELAECLKKKKNLYIKRSL